ncbi:MAG: hypothetical protein ACI33S_03725 [Bacilli bacterium]
MFGIKKEIDPCYMYRLELIVKEYLENTDDKDYNELVVFASDKCLLTSENSDYLYDALYLPFEEFKETIIEFDQNHFSQIDELDFVRSLISKYEDNPALSRKLGKKKYNRTSVRRALIKRVIQVRKIMDYENKYGEFLSVNNPKMKLSR